MYEDTPVTDVDGNLIRTSCGSVRAEKIVFATHFPFINFPGIYFARMHQERSYVLALENAGTLNGMYIGDGKDTLSFRQYDKYILLGGQGHRTGENRKGGCYDRLGVSAERLYPGSNVAARWSAQDCMTSDGIPFIGQYAADRPDWYVATGFQKWGMSSSMVSAMLLRDMICWTCLRRRGSMMNETALTGDDAKEENYEDNTYYRRKNKRKILKGCHSRIQQASEQVL